MHGSIEASTGNMDSQTTRFNGTLKKWNDERGFGFLVAEHGGQELFVHVSAFLRGGREPLVGEALSFEVELDRDGRKRAVRVRRAGDAEPRQARGPEQARPQHDVRRHSSPRRSDSSSFVPRLIALFLVVGVGWYAYGRYSERVGAMPLGVPQSVMNPEPWTKPRVVQPSYQCDGRQHCSQMTSCEEAKFFVRSCPDTKMDGDGDGVPCEQQLCGG